MAFSKVTCAFFCFQMEHHTANHNFCHISPVENADSLVPNLARLSINAADILQRIGAVSNGGLRSAIGNSCLHTSTLDLPVQWVMTGLQSCKE